MPRAIDPLVRRFLIAEAQLNHGQAQDDSETEAFLGLDLQTGRRRQGLPPRAGPLPGLADPARSRVSPRLIRRRARGVLRPVRRKSRLKAEYQGLDKRSLGALVREDVQITEPYDQGVFAPVSMIHGGHGVDDPHQVLLRVTRRLTSSGSGTGDPAQI